MKLIQKGWLYWLADDVLMFGWAIILLGLLLLVLLWLTLTDALSGSSTRVDF